MAASGVTVAGRLHDLSARLRHGTITAICGPNGAGKSTLLSCLAGLLDPDTGGVKLSGELLDEMPPRARARRLGYLPQSGEVAWDVTVAALVALGRLPQGDARSDAGRAAIGAALAATDLHSFTGRRVLTLSGGEKARVLLARVLAGEPDWILADEPLAALDLAHQLAMLRVLRRQAERGAGVVLVLHDLALAMNHADRVLVLDAGHLAADGAPDRALSASTIAQVWQVGARWIGEPGARALVT
ncbi:ABC transporter ATP-binding protein [Aurantiacibacter spongiae]|uniref:ABC transporter ATP-binding protein n=1 Tax=Aurantiacibacter spongiae TaxID=2488860 RepID=A0A3N5DNZ4_9SPHN|nr:ABC transporter ATP-binding protein [Aurantiacibacter spongiae]